MTRTLPEFYRIVLIVSEEVMKFAEYGYSVTLVRVWQCIEYLLGYMDGVGDNDNFGNGFLGTGLVDTVPNCEKFGFSGCDEGHIV